MYALLEEVCAGKREAIRDKSWVWKEKEKLAKHRWRTQNHEHATLQKEFSRKKKGVQVQQRGEDDKYQAMVTAFVDYISKVTMTLKRTVIKALIS